MSVLHSTTEITSDVIASDNPIHQRLLYAYVQAAAHYTSGELLEVGCGVGRGIDLLSEKATTYTAIDKNDEVLAALQLEYPCHTFIKANVPPLSEIEDNSFDTVVSFQVIEHIKEDNLFLKELYKVVRPGGKVIITTPNKLKSFTRNPWHVREYRPAEMKTIMEKHFDSVDMKGVHGSKKAMEYYERNRKSVQKITRFDVLRMQYWLPRPLLQLPYEFFNRLNRNKLMNTPDKLASSITTEDYIETDDYQNCLDYFCIGYKK